MQKDGVTRKAASKPLLTVPFSSELGNVTPVFVTPAKWSQVDMKQAAQSIAFGTTLNAGCNCIAPKVIVMSAEWSQVRNTSRNMFWSFWVFQAYVLDKSYCNWRWCYD